MADLPTKMIAPEFLLEGLDPVGQIAALKSKQNAARGAWPASAAAANLLELFEHNFERVLELIHAEVITTEHTEATEISCFHLCVLCVLCGS